MLVLGPWAIRRLRSLQIGQVIRSDGPQTHHPKSGTPTMGGLLILGAALTPTFLQSKQKRRFLVFLRKSIHHRDAVETAAADYQHIDSVHTSEFLWVFCRRWAVCKGAAAAR